jgi:hypothetical protein
MHAEMKKNPSRETCSSSAAPEPTLAAAGAKYRIECVLNNDERGRERPQADPRDLGGDRTLCGRLRLARTPPRGPRI